MKSFAVATSHYKMKTSIGPFVLRTTLDEVFAETGEQAWAQVQGNAEQKDLAGDGFILAGPPVILELQGPKEAPKKRGKE